MGCFLDADRARLAARVDGQLAFFVLRDISYIEAAGNYACLHVDGRTHVIRETMSRLEQLLRPCQFVRIHRSTLVNAAHVAEPLDHAASQAVRLEDGRPLAISRRVRRRLATRGAERTA
jgi:two-component system LytT family response regulator